MPADLPSWCGDFQSHWPWKLPQGDLALIALPFSPEGMSGQDFDRCSIQAPPSVRQSVAKRQAEYLAGRLCAREALSRSSGLFTAPARNDDGTPSWPAGTVGSISHTHGYAAAIAGPGALYRSTGMDLERPNIDETGQKLVRRILTPGEQSRFSTELRNQPGTLVSIVFSLKESLFKALFPLTGRRFYFQDAELIACSPDGTAILRLLKDLSPEWTAGTTLEGYYAPLPDHTLSLIPITAGPKPASNQKRG